MIERNDCDNPPTRTPKFDPINPDYYKTGGIETFDFIKAKLTKEELKGYLKGVIIKYITREANKNGLEDVNKLIWYANKLEELMKV